MVFTDALPLAPVVEHSDSSNSDHSWSQTSEGLEVVPDEHTSLHLTSDVTCEQAAGSTPVATDKRLPSAASQPFPPTPSTPPASSTSVVTTPQRPVSDDTDSDDSGRMDVA